MNSEPLPIHDPHSGGHPPGCPHEPPRRTFLGFLTVALSLIAGTLAGLPIVGYLLGAVLKPKKNVWLDVGSVAEFPVQQTRLIVYKNPHRGPWDGMTGESAAYVRHVKVDKFQVFAVNCAHLGCPVSWFPESGLFMCPCHGGVYYEDGNRASGPPTRGLYEHPYKVESGRLKILVGHLPTLQNTLDQEPV